MALSFEWDLRKARSNFRKHGVSFAEAAGIFGDPLSLTIPDASHSQTEERFVTMGHAPTGKLLIVVHRAGRQYPHDQRATGQPA